MTQVIGFLLFLTILASVELVIRWTRRLRHPEMAVLEQSTSAALKSVKGVAQRRTALTALRAAKAIPTAPDPREDDTPVISIAAARRGRGGGYHLTRAKKST